MNLALDVVDLALAEDSAVLDEVRGVVLQAVVLLPQLDLVAQQADDASDGEWPEKR